MFVREPIVALGSSPAIATRSPCALPVTPDSIGLASSLFGLRSASILSMWLCGCGQCRQTWWPGSALSFGRDNISISGRHIADRSTRAAEEFFTAGIQPWRVVHDLSHHPLRATTFSGPGRDRGAGGEVSASPQPVYAWNKQLIEGAAAVFAGGSAKEASREAKVTELYAKIGQPTVERDFYYGNLGDEPGRARGDGRPQPDRSVGAAAMCAAGIGALRGLSPTAAPEPEELALMRWLDEQYLATPFNGSRRTTAALRKASRQVNRKRVPRLMRASKL
jgi:HTH-like domain